MVENQTFDADESPVEKNFFVSALLKKSFLLVLCGKMFFCPVPPLEQTRRWQCPTYMCAILIFTEADFRSFICFHGQHSVLEAWVNPSPLNIMDAQCSSIAVFCRMFIFSLRGSENKYTNSTNRTLQWLRWQNKQLWTAKELQTGESSSVCVLCTL